MATRNVASVDLGAESGRVMLARFDGRGTVRALRVRGSSSMIASFPVRETQFS